MNTNTFINIYCATGYSLCSSMKPNCNGEWRNKWITSNNDDNAKVWNRYPLCTYPHMMMSCILLALTWPCFSDFKLRQFLSNLVTWQSISSDYGSINCSVRHDIYNFAPFASSRWVIKKDLFKSYNGVKANTIHQDPSITDKMSTCPIFEDLRLW
jgi:hypothetical protein